MNYFQAQLIQTWHPGDDLSGLEHNSNIDVTGGIRLKLDSAGQICQQCPSSNIWIVDGRTPDRIIEAVTLGKTIGTQIKARLT